MDHRPPKRVSTLDKYRKVVHDKSADEPAAKNEIRVTKRSLRINGYIMYAANLLIKDNEESIIIKSAGNAIARGVLVAEIVRHRIPGLHQVNKIASTDIIDEWEPLEEGLDKVTNTKTLPVLEIKLTKNPTAEDLKSPHYQEPLPKNEVQEIDLNRVRERPRGSRGGRRGFGRGGRRGFGRGGRGGRPFRPRDDYEERGPRGGYRDDYEERGPRGGYRDDYEERGPRGGYRDDYEERGHRDDYEERGPRGGYRDDYEERGQRGGFRGSSRGMRRGGDRGDRGGGRFSRGGRFRSFRGPSSRGGSYRGGYRGGRSNEV